jgi:phosphoribosylformylglycinamidine synthase
MGARPIALLNSLRFGSLDRPLTRRLFAGVVAGIAGYGNSIGIPTVGGEINFDDSYAGNPLVNVFCLGIAKADDIIKGVASGVGNPVYYVGAKTGRDGIHGATMASAEFDERSSEKRPAVQVGDPFMEKLLLEACLEVMKTDALVGIQDMGAAGLTCSTCEMGARGGSGVEIEVSLVPQRETGMSPYEIMLSESQERMLLVVKRGREAEVERVFEKWDLHAVRIGEVTDDRRMRVKHNGEVVAEIPTAALTDDAPVYRRPVSRPDYLAEAQRLSLTSLDTSLPSTEVFRRLLTAPGIASKRWVYRQYDHMVQTNTIVAPGFGAGVVRVKGSERALALAVDGNSRFVYLDPFLGTQLAVAEAARNVACAGAEPIGATNCLNFGNPERPEIMWQFARAVEGMGAACRALEIPITGGNVSLYNETDGKAILPTPVLGVVGLVPNTSHATRRTFQTEGDVVVLLGNGRAEFGGSEYVKTIHGLVRGTPPTIDLALEKALQRFLVESISSGLIRSAHDCAEGGLAVTVAECCFDSRAGATIDAPLTDAPPEQATLAALFAESASRVVVSVAPARSAELLTRAQDVGIAATAIGRVGGTRLSIAVGGRPVIDESLSELEALWSGALDRALDSTQAVA